MYICTCTYMRCIYIHMHILHGGSPANFVDLGGGVKTPQVYVSHIHVRVHVYRYAHVHICNVHTYICIYYLVARLQFRGFLWWCQDSPGFDLIYICTRLSTCTGTCTCMPYICIHSTHTQICSYIHKYVYTYVCIYIYMYIHIQVFIRLQIYIH